MEVSVSEEDLKAANREVGVDYDAMDPFKRMCQEYGVKTAGLIGRLGLKEAEWSRGESAHVIEFPDHYIAFTIEGLGTKNLVADMYATNGQESFYGAVAQCNAAMVLNDLITVGALPVDFGLHVVAGSGDWFKDGEHPNALAMGTHTAMNESGTCWGCGETPTLPGMADPKTVILSGAAWGLVRPKEKLIRGNVEDGDAIVLLGSSGIHANGLSVARKIASKLPRSYETKLPSGQSFGRRLLTPTRLYCKMIEACQKRDITIHYAVNITGHGWAKLMRLKEPFVYEISSVPDPQEEFLFMQERGKFSDREMYYTFNMGAGFALYVPGEDVHYVLSAASDLGIPAWNAGVIRKDGDRKEVLIRPKDVRFGAEDLAVR